MNWAHLHLILNHIPVLGAFLITVGLGGLIRHTEIRIGTISDASKTNDQD